MVEENGQPDIRDYISDASTWIRLAFMVLFIVVYVLASAVGLLVAIVQFLFKLFTGDVQPQLRALGGSLGRYLGEICEYETFRNEEKPYPWSPWPDAGPVPSRAKSRKAKTATTTVKRGRRRAADAAETAE